LDTSDLDIDEDSETTESWWSILYDAEDHQVLASFLVSASIGFRDAGCQSQTREILVKATRLVILNLFIEIKGIRMEITRLDRIAMRLRALER